MRLACDTGGTFTDLVVEHDDQIKLFKASTTPDDPVRGVLDAIQLAANHYGVTRRELLTGASAFIHGTTRAINAILTGATAKTAFLTTEGHPDVLVIREGGRIEPFNFRVPYPEPYVPRRLTFEVPERINAAGEILKPLDELAVVKIAERMKAVKIEAVGVCLLWSIVNSEHERRVGELLARHLPGVPVTLSYELNPTLREYRRASATVIDASLKPLMFAYLDGLTSRLRDAGFNGRTLMVTSQGGIMDAEAVARAPIHSINSGPAMAPVAGRFYSERDFGASMAIVADTGGTSYDVSLVRDGRIPWTRETWLGQRFRGHMTGFPSVDVKSIGAGGGSIAWVDSGGLLQVGPKSAGSTPGPVAYGKGGVEPTVTDCAIVLGYIDPDYFLGGAMKLDREAAEAAVRDRVAAKLGLSVEEAAAAVLALATEKMVGAIDEITVNQGIDPRAAVLVGGGGAAGINAVAVGKRLGCAGVLIPETGALLSAAGALMSELSSDHAQILFCASDSFPFDKIATVIEGLKAKCLAFAEGPGEGAVEVLTEVFVEARYPHQIWEIEVPVPGGEVDGPVNLGALKDTFHAMHKTIFEINDPASEVEFVTWRAKVRCRHRESGTGRLREPEIEQNGASRRRIYFSGVGWMDAPIVRFEAMSPENLVEGPAIVESSFTTVVIDPWATAARTAGAGLQVTF
jgi:N-methylhydantoinase A